MRETGKRIWTAEDFRYSTAQAGDLVEQAIVDNAMDCVPPACMSDRCSQIGEPHSHREDPETGEFRATFATFRKVSKGVWRYCGHCFLGETEERG